MRTILLLITILISGLAINAQSGVVVDGAAKPKDAKKLQKEQAKAFEMALRDKTVDFVQLVKFPMQYLDRPLRIEHVTLRNIQPYTDSGVTMYPISFAQQSETTTDFPFAGHLTFISDISLAQQLVKHIQGMRSPGSVWGPQYDPIADVTFEVKQGDTSNGLRYYLARVDCVSVYGVFSKKTNYGKCQ